MMDSTICKNNDKPKGKSTPLNYSPVPSRKQISNREKKKRKKKRSRLYYPNCDVSVWLRSCEEEITVPLSGKITGTIPKWLNGDLYRNGPGSLKAGQNYFEHLFDCSALLHRFSIKNGNVTYQCRFLQSEIYKQIWKANRIVTTQFGTASVPDPCHTIFQRVAAIFKSQQQSDNAMISVYPFGDELYAFSEIPTIYRVNQETLDTEDGVDVSKHIAIVNHTSHPHVMFDGTVYNLAMSVTITGPKHNIVCFPPKSDKKSMFDQAKIVATIPARWPLFPSYMHTFGITENYFVIVEQPLSISLAGLAVCKLTNEPMAGCFRWYEEEKTQINLICRHTGLLKYQFYTRAFFYLHLINQFEKSDHLILDVCSYKDPSMLDCMYIEAMKNMQNNANYAELFRSSPIRFVLPLHVPKTNKVKKNLVKLSNTRAKAYLMPEGSVFAEPEILSKLGCETPRIFYEKHLGKPYRYFYAISADVDGENPGTIIKVDTIKKKSYTWCEKNCYPSEPIFIPNPNSQSEDDGVVMASMVWGGNDKNHAGLVLLDAKTFTEMGRAEFFTKSPVPKCLHAGRWRIYGDNGNLISIICIDTNPNLFNVDRRISK